MNLHSTTEIESVTDSLKSLLDFVGNGDEIFQKNVCEYANDFDEDEIKEYSLSKLNRIFSVMISLCLNVCMRVKIK